MDQLLYPVRVFISPDEAFFASFEKISDTPLVNTRGTGSMFSTVCPDGEAFGKLTGLLGIDSETSKVLRERYDETKQADCPVAVLFSDERSGSNRIELKSAQASGESVEIEMSRHRGLTMDMAYTFFVLAVPQTVSRVAKALVTDSGEEARIF